MRSITMVSTAGGALLAAAVLAVTVTGPSDASAVAGRPVAATSIQQVSLSAATPRPAPAPLTESQKALIDDYLAAHPGRAQALAATAARWKAFAEAHPELAAELAKVAALPPTERRAELSRWFADHPEEKAVFTAWVKQTREDRVERRHERHERRHERRENRRDAGSATLAPPTSGSAQTSAAQV